MADAVVEWTDVLDPEVIEGLMELGGEDDPELFHELVDLFCQDSPDRVRQMVEGADQADWTTVEGMAHALKSSAANLGALGLSDLCRDVETQSKAGEYAAATELAARISIEYGRVEQALRMV